MQGGWNPRVVCGVPRLCGDAESWRRKGCQLARATTSLFIDASRRSGDSCTVCLSVTTQHDLQPNQKKFEQHRCIPYDGGTGTSVKLAASSATPPAPLVEKSSSAAS